MKWKNTVRLVELAKVLNGYAFKSKEYTSQGIRIIRITNVQKGCIKDDNPKYVEAGRKDEFSRYMLESGDILISLTGNVGRVGVIDQALLPAALNQRVGALKINNDSIVPAYLYQLLNSDNFERDAVKNSKGVAQLNLSSKWIEEYQIPLPPLSEQKRIAGILDAADALRAKRREALAQLDTLLQSLFLDLFGDPVTNPKGWEVVELGTYTSKVGSGSTPKGGNESYYDDGISLIRSLNVRDGEFKFKKLAHIDEEQASKLKNVVVKENDVLLNITGASVARVCRAPAGALPARVNQHVCIIRTGKALNTIYTEKLLLTDTMKQKLLGIGESGATRQAITKAQVLRLNIPLPPLSLQQRFAAIVKQVEAQKARMRTQLTELDTLFAALQQRAFNGEL